MSSTGVKPRTRRTLLPAVLIVILILVFSAALLREGRLRDLDIARLGSLEAATSITEDVLEGRPISNPADSVSGWGIYTPEGTPIAIRGTAPDRLSPTLSAQGVSEETINNHLRSIRTMSFGGESGSSRGHGFGMRRLVLIDWDIRENGNPEVLRIAGAAGLTLLAISLLIMQQVSARRFEKQHRLVQLGLAARTLTHEIRNPLGVLKAQQALLRKTLPPEYAGNLTVIADEVNRLSALTDRVREWLDDPAGNPIAFDVSRVIRGILERQPWDIRLELTDPGPFVRMDSALFASAIVNLVRNAVESQEEIPDVSAPEVILTLHGKIVRIIVQDRGKGLPEGNTEDLFNPFFTTKIKGSGVGLALARQFIEAADGTLRIENRSSGGVRAIMELPREKT